jgi:hypothetical protein
VDYRHPVSHKGILIYRKPSALYDGSPLVEGHSGVAVLGFRVGRSSPQPDLRPVVIDQVPQFLAQLGVHALNAAVSYAKCFSL